MAVRANTEQSPNSVLMLGQRRIRLTGIELAMDCDAGPALNRYWVGRPTLCVRGTSYRRVRLHRLISECHSTFKSEKETRQNVSLASIAWILVSTGDGGGKNRPTRTR